MLFRVFQALLLLGGVLLFSLALPAQTLPVDAATGKVYYAEEVLVKDGPQVELYHRAKALFAKAGNPKEILQVDDLANGVLIGRSQLPLVIKKEAKTQTYQLRYTLKIEMEDDRYWYSLTDFTLPKVIKTNSAGPGTKKIIWYPLEDMLKPTTNSSENISLPKATHQQILALIEEIKKSMD